VYLALQNGRWCYGSLSLDGARHNFETLHGAIPGLIIVRVARFRRPLARHFSPQALSTPRHSVGKANIEYNHFFDVATTTRIRAMPFRGILKIQKYGPSRRLNKSVQRFFAAYDGRRNPGGGDSVRDELLCPYTRD
jgi:hypothetical protein